MAEFKRKTLSPILKKHHLSFPNCGLVDETSVQRGLRFFTYPLDNTNEIYGILCDNSAFNTSFALYLIRDNNFHSAERLYFPSYSKTLGWAGSNTLYNASYNPDTGILSSKTRFHAQKDCGNKAFYKWTGKGFRLLIYRIKEKCSHRTARRWPLIYRYKHKKRLLSQRRHFKSRKRKAYRKAQIRKTKKARRKARYKRQKRLRKRRYVRRTRYRKRRARRYRRLRLKRARQKALMRKYKRRRRKG